MLSLRQAVCHSMACQGKFGQEQNPRVAREKFHFVFRACSGHQLPPAPSPAEQRLGCPSADGQGWGLLNQLKQVSSNQMSTARHDSSRTGWMEVCATLFFFCLIFLTAF